MPVSGWLSKNLLQFSGNVVTTSNEKEISYGRVSWQARRSCFAMGPLASSIG